MAGPKLTVGDFGDEVARLHENLARSGFEVPAAEVKRRFFGPATRAAVAECQSCNQVEVTGHLDEATAAALGASTVAAASPTARVPPVSVSPAPAAPLVGGGGATDVGSTQQGRAGDTGALTGFVLLENGLPAKNLKIKFSRPSLGAGPESVGQPVQTDENGQFTAAGLDASELIASTSVGKKNVVLAPVGAGDRGDPIFTVPVDVAPPESEFARLTAAVMPVIGGGKLGSLEESGDRRDLYLLHHETGWDTRLLALSVLADRAVTIATAAGNTLGIPHGAAYAAMRAGLPTDPAALATVHPDTFGQALTSAADAGIVELDAKQQHDAVEQFRLFRTKELGARNPADGASTINQLIDAVGLDPVPKLAGGKSQLDLVREAIIARWDGPTPLEIGPTPWKSARDNGLTDESEEKLKLHGYLAFLTLNNAPLIKQVRDQYHFVTIDTFADILTEETNKLDLAETWADVVTALGDASPLPEAFSNAAEPIKSYTEEIARRIALSFPTQVVVARIKRKEIVPHDDAAINAITADFLLRASKANFKLGEQNPTEFLSGHKDLADSAGVTDDNRGEVEEALTTLHRLYQVTPNNEMLALLSQHGIRSAYEVVNYPKDTFVSILGKHTASRADVELVYKRAEQVSSIVYTFFSMARQAINAPATAKAAAAADTVRDTAITNIKAMPSMESLFGPMDYCECDHCRSVLGPAAYLVDLLKFLEVDDKVWSGFTEHWKQQHGSDYPFAKPYDELVARRPDIVNLQLSCENTNIELPTIDIVNEILEYRLLPTGTADPGQGGVRDSGATASVDVLAEPEFVRDEVYSPEGPLLKAVYPHVLPFDLWYETAREFAEWLEIPLWRLRSIFASPKQEESDASAVLGLSPAEFALISDPAASTWWARFGLVDDKDLRRLTNARTLARALNVTYLELAALLETRFINPGLDDLDWVLAAGISVASAQEWRTRQPEALLKDPPVDAEQKVVWTRLQSCNARLGAINTAYKIPSGTAEAELNALPEGLFSQVVLLHSADTSCNFAATTLITGRGEPLSEQETEQLLLRLDVFVRLWRKLGWTIRETDSALTASGSLGPALSAAALHSPLSGIAKHIELRRALPDASLEDLTTLLNGLDTVGVNSRYRQLFLTRSRPHRDEAFDAPFGEYLKADEDGKPVIGEHFPALQAGVGLTRADIATIINDADPNQAWESAPLSVPLVSYLRQHAVLSAALDASVTDIVTLGRLSGVHPFMSPDATDSDAEPDLIAFIELFRMVSGSGLTMAEVASLIGPATMAPDGTELRPRVPDEVAQSCTAVVELRNQQVSRDKVAADKEASSAVNLAQQAVDEAAKFAEAQPADQDVAKQRLQAAQEVLRQATDRLAVEQAVKAVDDADKKFTGAKPADKEAAERDLHAAQEVLREAEVRLLDSSRLRDNAVEAIAIAEAAARAAIIESADAAAALASQLVVGEPLWPSATDPVFQRYVSGGDDSIERAHTLLAKTLALADRLGLDSTEIHKLPVAHVLTVSDVADGEDKQEKLRNAATVRFAGLRTILTYCAVRKSFAAGSSQLHSVVDTEDYAKRLAALSSRTAAEITAAAAQVLSEGTTKLDVGDLERVCQVMTLAATIGVDPATLARWANMIANQDSSQYANLAREIKDAARTHLGARWPQAAAVISDRLRQRQRDALVALCLNRFGKNSIEELYEEILLDPGSEPVLRTSRIRQAISAVQLFVQRILLNVEPNVHPSSVKAAQWDWMKRYRVWEANRKIFLFPENWLEPEFRDDKSHLFNELEGTLLQDDVTNDLAEDALLTYLKGLDEIARLDIIGTYCLQDYLDPTMNVLHVVGRTFASPHKYFYRRMTHGIWTPWQPVDLDISGDHIVLAHWRDRLYIFWVTFLDKQNEPTASSDDPNRQGALAGVSLESLQKATGGAPKRFLVVKLHWSEYLGEGWSPTNSSDFGEIPRPAGDLNISVHSLTTPQDETVQIFLSGSLTATFVLRGRNSPVEVNPVDALPLNAPAAVYTIDGTAGNSLSVEFAPVLTSVNGGQATGVKTKETVLGPSVGTTKLVHPANTVDLGGPDIGPLVSPFFYEDSRRTFFVQPYLREDTIEESTEKWTLVEVSPPPQRGAAPWADLVPQAAIPTVQLHPPLDELVGLRQRVRDVVINPATAVLIDDRIIGARNVVQVVTTRTADLTSGINEINVSQLDNVAGVIGVSSAQSVTGNAGTIISVGGGDSRPLATAVAHDDALVVQGVAHVNPISVAEAGLTTAGPIRVLGKAGLTQQFKTMQFIR